MFCLNLMRIALELAKENPVYEGLATKFFQHYIYVARGDEAHGRPRLLALGRRETASSTTCCATRTASFHKFRVRSLVGLIPLFAVERLELDWIEPFPEFRGQRGVVHRATGQDLVAGAAATWSSATESRVYVLAIVDQNQMRRLLERVLGPETSSSRDCGIRSLSRFHEQHPFCFGDSEVGYEPAEAAGEDQGRQLQLARPRLVPDLVPDDRVAAQAWARPTGRASRSPLPGERGQPPTCGEMARRSPTA